MNVLGPVAGLPYGAAGKTAHEPGEGCGVSGARLVAWMAVCGLVGACGTGDAIYSASTVTAERANIRGLLHDLRDLPAGFSIRPRKGWKAPIRPAAASCRTVFAAVAGDPPPQGRRAHAEVAFEGDRLGELGGAGVASYHDDRAPAAFERLAKALKRCEKITTPVRGTRLVAADLPRRAAIDIDGVGEEVAAGRLRGRLLGYPYEMHVVFLRVGPTLISVVHTGMGGADAWRTADLIRAVAARVTGGTEYPGLRD